MSKTGAAFSVRFLRNGDQITVVRNVVDKDGNGAALFQVVDTTTGTPTPDWTQTENQPVIQLGVRSAAGEPWPDNGQCSGEKLEHGGDRLCIVQCGSSYYFSFMVRSADSSCCIAICAAT